MGNGRDSTALPAARTVAHFGPANLQSGDAPPNGTSVAVQAIVTDPTDANKIYIGTVNGGVWETLNGGTTWTPLSDKRLAVDFQPCR